MQFSIAFCVAGFIRILFRFYYFFLLTVGRGNWFTTYCQYIVNIFAIKKKTLFFCLTINNIILKKIIYCTIILDYNIYF